MQSFEIKTVEINEGGCDTLEKEITHCPIREYNSIGLVIESARREYEKGIHSMNYYVLNFDMLRFINLVMPLLQQSFI